MTNIVAVVKNPFSVTNQSTPVTLKNNSASVNQNYLSHLLDVDATSVVDGDTLVYNANTGKYDVAPPNLGSAIVDGGTF
jgi:hypothetical protein